MTIPLIQIIKAHLNEPQDVRGSYVFGYIDGRGNLDAFLEDFNRAGTTTFSIRHSFERPRDQVGTSTDSEPQSKGKSFGSPSKFGKKERVLWKCNRGAPMIPFIGSPFICQGNVLLECQHGRQYRKKKAEKETSLDDHNYSNANKKKRRVLLQPSKKMGCTASIRIRRIHLFQEYALKNTRTKNEQRKRKEEILLKIKQRISGESPPDFIDRYYLEVPLERAHTNHPVGSNAGIAQPLHPRIIDKIHQLVSNGETDAYNIRKKLNDYVDNELLPTASVKPSPLDRAYYPSPKDIQNHIFIARKKKIYDLLDQDTLKEKITEWERDGRHTFFFREGIQSSCNDDTQSEQNGTTFMFVHQENWQRELLKRYGNHICLLDATYKTTMYALPLFFLCVKTNVDYQVVAEFIIESETGESISEALRIIHSWNKDYWRPRFFMTDYSEAEINAIEEVFHNCAVYICDFHREQAWLRWIKRKEHNLNLAEQQQLLTMLRNISYAQTSEHFEVSVAELKDSALWSNQLVKRYMDTTWLPIKRRWARAFRSEDFDVNVHTNNGIEAQHKTLKYTYLARQPNKTLSGIVSTIIDEFLKGNKECYENSNRRCLATYRAYDKSIPTFLHNRPKKVVKHCLNRIHEAENDFSSSDIVLLRNLDRGENRSLYLVKSTSDRSVSYTVDMEKPSCQCKDWLKSRLPCKHLFAVISNTDETWMSIQENYREGVYMTLDVDFNHQTPMETQNISGALSAVSEIFEEEMDVNHSELNKSTHFLELTKQRKEVLSKIEEIKTSTYLCESITSLQFAVETMDTVNTRLKATIPRSKEGLPLINDHEPNVRLRKNNRKRGRPSLQEKTKKSSLKKRKKRKR